MDKTAFPSPYFMEDPKLSKKTKEFLKVFNQMPHLEQMSVEEARQALVKAQQSMPVDLSGIEESDRTISVEDVTVKLKIIRPKGLRSKLPVFVFVHGGGWVLGCYEDHKRLVRDLVVETGMCCVFPEYTLSPEAKFPQPLEEVYFACKWVSQNGNQINVDGSRLAIVGNSVGGNMSFVAAMKANELKDGLNFKCQVLLWPVTDLIHSWPSYIKYGVDRFLTLDLFEWMVNHYLESPLDINSIYASPLNSPIEKFKGLSPTLIICAQEDILKDQAKALYQRLDEADVCVSAMTYYGVIHDFGVFNALASSSQVKNLIIQTGAYLKKHLK